MIERQVNSYPSEQRPYKIKNQSHLHEKYHKYQIDLEKSWSPKIWATTQHKRDENKKSATRNKNRECQGKSKNGNQIPSQETRILSKIKSSEGTRREVSHLPSNP